MLQALCCNLHTVVPDSFYETLNGEEINTLIICVTDKWMPQPNFTAKKVIYLSEIFWCIERSDFFFSFLRCCEIASALLANLLRQIFSLQCWQGQENVAGGNQMSSIQSWLASRLAPSLWFLKICQKSCVVWKWRQDFWTKINSWIFWTAHVQSSNGNVLEGSPNGGLWDQLHQRSDYTTSIWNFQRI